MDSALLDHIRTLTTARIREEQDIVFAQIPLAFEQHNTAALKRLQERHEALAFVIFEREFEPAQRTQKERSNQNEQ